MKNRNLAHNWRNLIILIGLSGLLILSGCSENLESSKLTNTEDSNTADPLGDGDTPLPSDDSESSSVLEDPTLTGDVLKVCPSGCAYSLPSQALAAATDGSLIEISYGNYFDCGYVRKNNVVIRGISDNVGRRPRIHSKVCGRKAILVVQGSHVLIENLEFSDAIDAGGVDANWAGVRLDSTATAYNLKIRNCHFHDSDNGVLGNNGSFEDNRLVIEDSLFENLGRDGYAHGIYIGSGVNLFVLRNSIVRSNRNDGHLVKSRAETNIIECNSIVGLEGVSSYAVDLPDGGDTTIQSNVIHAGTKVSNSGNFIVQFAAENGKNAPHRLQLLDNYVVNDFRNQGHIKINVADIDVSGWADNTYVGVGDGLKYTGMSPSMSFTKFSSRAQAGLPNYDGTMASLPSPPLCP